MSNVGIELIIIALFYVVGAGFSVRNEKRSESFSYQQSPAVLSVEIMATWVVLYIHTAIIWMMKNEGEIPTWIPNKISDILYIVYGEIFPILFLGTIGIGLLRTVLMVVNSDFFCDKMDEIWEWIEDIVILRELFLGIVILSIICVLESIVIELLAWKIDNGSIVAMLTGLLLMICLNKVSLKIAQNN